MKGVRVGRPYECLNVRHIRKGDREGRPSTPSVFFNFTEL
jgi:hypothetical protein